MNDFEAAADKARLTGQIRSFMTWLGEGRKLTQTGRIGLADARHLVEVLGTGDRIDPEIGDRIFKTRSSEQLAYLTRVEAWMKAARLIRVTGTRLVPVKKNAGLADRPLDLMLALLDAYPRLGKSLFPRNAWRQSLVGDEFAFIGPEILTRLLTCQDACPLSELHEAVLDMIAAMYTFHGLSELQMEMLRRTIETDVAIAVAALDVIGVAVVDQANDTAGLTDLGRWAIRRLADVARVRTRIAYEYDFGDGWEHELVVEARTVAGDGQAYPACLAGEGACPPEDCGGVYGFAELKEVLAGPDSAERDEMLEWMDEDFDPTHFDLAAANATVAAI